MVTLFQCSATRGNGMSKLLTYLVFLAVCLGLTYSTFTPLNDAMDFTLYGIAAGLLSGVMWFLLFAVFALYRTFRYWKGAEIREDGLLNHDGLKSELIPWEQIDALAIKMVDTAPSFRGFGSYRRGKAPAFHIHVADQDKYLHIHFSDMLGKIGALQEQLRAKSPRYKQHDIDWVERWSAKDPLIQLKKMSAERKQKNDAPVIARVFAAEQREKITRRVAPPRSLIALCLYA
jgi:hypothetical protein